MIIGLTGRIAAGKGQIVEYLKNKNFSYHTFSNEIREAAAKITNFKFTRRNLQDLGNKLRKEKGGGEFGPKNWLLNLILEKITF